MRNGTLFIEIERMIKMSKRNLGGIAAGIMVGNILGGLINEYGIRPLKQKIKESKKEKEIKKVVKEAKEKVFLKREA